ncbi:MAG TPA: tripartite tricarboxylate transporter substrate binding protein [Eoetvoesiella sp.]
MVFNKMAGLKRAALCAAVGLVFTSVATAADNDKNFPNKLITILTPFPPGSTSDMIPRLVAPIMSKSMGVSVIVENRAGAAGSIGAAKVATAAPDGYNILMATTGVLAINQWLYSGLTYSPEKDFAPVINAAATPNLLVVNPSIPANTLQELVALAKSKPGELTFASGGQGTTSHMCGEQLKVAAGIDIVHVPYRGPAPAVQDLIGGVVTMMCDNLSNVKPYVESGRLKAIALTDKKRSPQLDQVPTSGEGGLPTVLAGNWYSFVVPAGTPKPVVERLNTEFAKALHDPSVTERLEKLGLTVIADTPDEFGAYIKHEATRMKAVVDAAGLKPN